MPLLLLVEAHEILRRHTARMLESELPDLRVVSMPDAQSARRAARVQAPDIIVSERGLPDGDGSLLLAQLKRLYPRTFGILITGNLPGRDLPPPTPIHADAVLRKPFEPSDLIERVRQGLPRRAAPASGIVPAPKPSPAGQAAPPRATTAGRAGPHALACHDGTLRLSQLQRHELLNRLSRVLVCVRAMEADLRTDSSSRLTTPVGQYIDTIVHTVDELTGMVTWPEAHIPEGS